MRKSSKLTAVVALAAAVCACGGPEEGSPAPAFSSAAEALNAAGYVGCYVDSSTRALPAQLASSGATIESCVAAASAKGLAYAGLQYGGECWAGNTLAYAHASDADCSMKCTASSSETCGGSWRNSVYSVPGAKGYMGCYTDGATRALPTQVAASSATMESCIAAAKARNLAYAGLQYGGECWAGNTLGYTRAADTDCSMKCTANSSESCGGSWRNSVYATSVSAPPQPSPTPAPTPSPTPTPSPLPPGTNLRDAAARHGLYFGEGWGPPPWTNSEAIASAQFDAYMLPGTVGRIWLGPGSYDWSQPDSGVQYAAAHPGFHYSSAQLFYGIFVGQNSTELVPPWLRGPDSASGYGAPTVTADQLSQHMHDFLTAYVQRYGSTCYRTEIANELVSSPATDWYYQHASIGAAGGKSVAQYVDQLVRWAKAANPNVKLYLNDTRNEDSQTSMGTANAFGTLVRTLQAMGTPLDGLGFQCHERLNGGYNYASVQGVFAYFASLGYDLHITEMGITAPVDASGVVSASNQAAQAAQFASLVNAFLAGAGTHGKSIATWGTTDTNAFDVGGLLWDVRGQPKAAYQSVLNALNQ